MAIQGGLGSSLLIGAETTTGTAVALTRSLEYNSESLHLEKGVIDGAGLRGSGLFPRSSRHAFTTRTVNGDVELDVATKGMGLLFQQMMGGTSASAVLTGTAYQQVHVPGSLVNRSLTVQKLVPRMSDGTLVPFTYRGMKVTGWELACEVGGILTLSLTFDGWDETTGTAAGTPSYASGTEVFHFAQGVLTLGGTVSTTSGVASVSGGTTVASVKGATITGDIPLKTDRYFFGSAGVKAEQTENGWRSVTGSFDAEFVTAAALYDTMAADTATAMKLTFTGTTAITGSTYPTLEVLIPSIRLGDGSPQIDGPDVIGLSTSFTAYDNGVDAAIQLRSVTADTSVS